MIFLCIFLLSVGCLASENYWLGLKDGYDVKPEVLFSRPAPQKDLVRPHNPHIERPCPNKDEHCVRVFLAKNSKCSPTFGPAPDPYVMGNSIIMDVPHANMTIETFNEKLIGINSGKIKEFYINKETDILVLEIEFRKLIVDSPKTVMTHYRKGKEPIEATDITIVEFKRLSLTLTVKNINDINPAKGHVHTHLSRTPSIKVGPGLVNVKDLPRTNVAWMDDMGLTAREALLLQAPLYMAVYLQSKICDFRHH